MSRILIVDDDWLACSAVRVLLQRSDEIVVADGAASGLKALDEFAFDRMIVDLFMPHMHGFESIRLFHQIAPRVPLIAISGYVSAERRMQAPDFLQMAVKLGASNCLRKPLATRALLNIVKECLQTDTEAAPAGQTICS